MRCTAAWGCALLLMGLTGCGGGAKIVSVSGVVKLNGRPYKNAIVSLQPIGSKENPNPGRGSVGVTDENGRYSLTYDGEHTGALVGRHHLRIFTKMGSEIPDTEGDPAAAEQAAKGKKPTRLIEPIPIEWNENSIKEFEVPSGGTDQANFDIENPKIKN